MQNSKRSEFLLDKLIEFIKESDKPEDAIKDDLTTSFTNTFNSVLDLTDDSDLIISIKNKAMSIIKNRYTGHTDILQPSEAFNLLALFLSIQLTTTSKMFNETIYEDIKKTISELIRKYRP